MITEKCVSCVWAHCATESHSAHLFSGKTVLQYWSLSSAYISWVCVGHQELLLRVVLESLLMDHRWSWSWSYMCRSELRWRNHSDARTGICYYHRTGEATCPRGSGSSRRIRGIKMSVAEYRGNKGNNGCYREWGGVGRLGNIAIMSDDCGMTSYGYITPLY